MLKKELLPISSYGEKKATLMYPDLQYNNIMIITQEIIEESQSESPKIQPMGLYFKALANDDERIKNSLVLGLTNLLIKGWA